MAKAGTTPTSGGLAQIAFRVNFQSFTEMWAQVANLSLAELKLATIELAKQRMRLMGDGVRFSAARAALLPRRGQSEWVDLNGSMVAHQDLLADPYNYKAIAGSPNWDDTDIAQTDVVASYFATLNNRHKITHHAGVPDGLIRTNPEGPSQIMIPEWFTAFNLWTAFLKANTWGWIGRVQTTPVQIVAWGTDSDSGITEATVTTASTGPLFALGDLVLISGMRMEMKGQRSLNGGPYEISRIQPGAGSVTYTLSCTRGIDLTKICFKGKIREYSLQVYAVDHASILRQGSHRRGPVFGLQRGRRRTQVSHM